jgi:two-component system sensor histidine kinase KdpD
MWTALSPSQDHCRRLRRPSANRLGTGLPASVAAIRLQGSDYANDILRLAARENVTQIVLGQSQAGLWRRMLGRSLPEALMRGAGGIEIHIVPGDETRPSLWPRLRPLLSRRGLGPELAVALASVAAAVAVAEALSPSAASPRR